MNFYVNVGKEFLQKQRFDFHRPDVDLHNFHPQLRIFLAINGIFFNKRESIFRFVWPFIGISFSIVAIVLEIIFISHYLSIKDYSYATECFCYTVILGCIPMVYISIFTNTDKIFDIIEKINDDYTFIRNMGTRYRQPFLEGQLRIWQLCWAWFVFVSFVGGLYVLMPIASLCYQTLFVTQNEHTIRPLQFPVWLPHDDPYRTPNYEIFMGVQSFLIILFVQTFCVYIYTLFHILLHYYVIMDMIILDFEVLFEGLDEAVALLSRYDERRMKTQHILNKRMGNIVNMHLSVFAAVKTVSSVYGPPLVYQVMFSAIAICLIAYQLAEKLDNGNLDILFCLLGIAACLQLWIPCYLGTKIRNKFYIPNDCHRGSHQAFALGDACWDCGWHLTSLGLLVRQDIIIFILRTQKPVTIKYTGLPNVELETFSSLMSKSYSYFNMLRQYS